jgi:hypothetical protein
VIVASVPSAIGAIAERAPDLILAPALLSPPDEAELLTHMKQLDTAPYIQMLTLPALDMLVDAPAEQGRRGLFGPFFNRRPVSLALRYDRNMVAAQIADGLSRARELRIDAAMLAYRDAAEHAPRQVALARRGGGDVLDAAGAFLDRQSHGDAADRRVALRKGRGDVPFAKELDLAGPCRADAPATPPQELASLLASVFATVDERSEPAHARFAHGLRRLVGARDVQVRSGSAASSGRLETLYFDVPGDDRLRTTLRVVFDRDHEVTDAEFKVLTAAAWLTAAVLELEKPVSTAVDRPARALLAEQVA